jgi:hypothetical protein
MLRHGDRIVYLLLDGLAAAVIGEHLRVARQIGAREHIALALDLSQFDLQVRDLAVGGDERQGQQFAARVGVLDLADLRQVAVQFDLGLRERGGDLPRVTMTVDCSPARSGCSVPVFLEGAFSVCQLAAQLAACSSRKTSAFFTLDRAHRR